MGDKGTPFERNLQSYQRYTLTLFYPPLLSFFAACSGYFIANYDYFLSYAFQRFLMLSLVESDRGAFSAVYFVPLLVALAILGLFLFLTLMAAKGKFWALAVGSLLYLADSVYAFLGIVPSVFGTMSLPVYLVQVFLHLAFLVLYGFAIGKYAKLVRPSGKGSSDL